MNLLRACTRTKRILALVFAAALVLSLCACGEDEVKLIKGTNTVGGYSFKYPETWTIMTDGTATRISADALGGALPTAYVNFTVVDNEKGQTAEEYWGAPDRWKVAYEKAHKKSGDVFEFEGGSGYLAVLDVTAVGGTNLDGQPEDTKGKQDYVVRQIVFEGAGKICLATYMASEDNDDAKKGVVTDIKESFKFTKATEGEKGNENTDFSIPTPEGWSLDVTEAYYQLSHGEATITASVYSAGKNSTAKACWDNLYNKELARTLTDYKLVKLTEDVSLGGIRSVDTEYTGGTVSGGKYHFRQCTGVYNGEVFVVVLTASEEDYAGAVAGYEEIIKGFKLK